MAADSLVSRGRVQEFHLYVEQPCLQVGHSFLPQSQVPDDHVQGFVCEEALVHRGHAGRTTNVPDGERHRVLLCETRRQDERPFVCCLQREMERHNTQENNPTDNFSSSSYPFHVNTVERGNEALMC